MSLDTTNPHNYNYITEQLVIHILGGIKMNNLERMRVTLSIKKVDNPNIVRHSIDLYNDTMIEKLTRTVAERIEIGTSIVRKCLQDLLIRA